MLPAHIDDWVDSSAIVKFFFPAGGLTAGAFWKFFLVMNKEGTQIQPEGMLNLNAGLIMTTCFIVAYFSGLMRAAKQKPRGPLPRGFALLALVLISL